MGAHFLADDELVGIDDIKNKLTDWLLSGETRRTVIAVVGEGELGNILSSFYYLFIVELISYFTGIHVIFTFRMAFHDNNSICNLIIGGFYDILPK